LCLHLRLHIIVLVIWLIAPVTVGNRYPGVDDPMAVLERYVDEKKLRFVDLFFQMDRDRSGSLEVAEVERAIRLMDLDLNHVQLSELMTRMDLDGDGQ